MSRLIDLFGYSPSKPLFHDLPDEPLVKAPADHPAGIGIEIEVEGLQNTEEGSPDYYGWQVKKDGTLRDGGKEFVSCYLKANHVKAALDSLFDCLNQKEKGAKFSSRTSVHVHLDCRTFTLHDVAVVLATGMTVESLLFHFAGDGRQASKFCVPSILSLGDGVFDDLLTVPTAEYVSQRLFHTLCKYFGNHYASINVDNLFPYEKAYPYGSIEFRHMAGTKDRDKILLWIKMLLNLRNYAVNTSPEVLLKTLSAINVTSKYSEYLYEIFGRECGDVLSQTMPIKEIYKEMSNNISIAKAWLSPPVAEVNGVKFLKSTLAKRIQGISFNENERRPPPGFPKLNPEEYLRVPDALLQRQAMWVVPGQEINLEVRAAPLPEQLDGFIDDLEEPRRP